MSYKTIIEKFLKWWIDIIIMGIFLIFNLWLLASGKSSTPILQVIACLVLFAGSVYCAYIKGTVKRIDMLENHLDKTKTILDRLSMM